MTPQTDPVAPTAPIQSAVASTVVEASPGFVRRHRWLLLAGAVLLAGGVWLAVQWWRGAEVPTVTVLRRDLVQTVVASGRVEAPHRLDVGAQVTGTVLRIPIEEGEGVAAGAVLVELEAAELAANERQADMAVVQAQSRLRQLDEVEGPVAAQALLHARATLTNARAALARTTDLHGRGFVGKAALDDAREAVALADAEVRSAQLLSDTNASTGSGRALASADVAGAEASADAAHARSGYAVVRAPVAGTLIARSVEVGDVVQPGKVLMTLSPRGRTQVVVAIDERNLGLLAPGQQALVSADAYPADRFAATLVYINPGINATTGAVEVKLDVPEPPPVLRQDMTVSVDIEVARRDGALILPLGAVQDDAAGAYVLRIEGRHARRRPITTGLRSGGLAEVLSGLAEGDVVVAAADAATADARVRGVPMGDAIAGAAE